MYQTRTEQCLTIELAIAFQQMSFVEKFWVKLYVLEILYETLSDVFSYNLLQNLSKIVTKRIWFCV
jgi:hypothetical protein